MPCFLFLLESEGGLSGSEGYWINFYEYKKTIKKNRFLFCCFFFLDQIPTSILALQTINVAASGWPEDGLTLDKLLDHVLRDLRPALLLIRPVALGTEEDTLVGSS